MWASDIRIVAQLLSNPLAQRRAILGVDVGTKKAGFALCESIAHKSVSIGVHRPPPHLHGMWYSYLAALRPMHNVVTVAASVDLASCAADLINKHKVAALVVGWPLNQLGQVTDTCAAVEEFVRALRSLRVHTPALPWDERGSSVAARQAIRSASDAKRTRKGLGVTPEQRSLVDSHAAVIILDSAVLALRAASGGVVRPPTGHSS